MSDQPSLPGERREPPRDVKADLQSAASETQARAGEVARNLRHEANETVQAVRAEGEDLATLARDKVEQAAEQQKEVGAEKGHHLADAVRRVADDLEDASPEIARHVRSAAESVDSMASALRERSVGDLLGEVNAFAHRQPVAFFGAAMVAGFALTRFARSTARDDGMARQGGYPAGYAAGRTTGRPMSGSTGYPTGMGRRDAAAPHSDETHRNPTMAPGWVPEASDRKGTTEGELRPATMPAATLGGAAAHKPGTAAPGSMPGPAGGTV